jgi:phage baseplate assembly protein W
VRRLEVYEQARAQWGERPAETLMESVVPAGQDMATRSDVDAAVARIEARCAILEERMRHVAWKSFVLASHGPTHALIIGLSIR